MVHIKSNSTVLQTLPGVKPKADPAAPGVLAEELAAARAEFAAARQSVIERGVQRIQDITALKAELDAENDALGKVVADATSE